MPDGLSQVKRTARVLALLDESYRALRDGDRAGFERAADEAVAVDAAVVDVVRGGITIGKVPNPQFDPGAWEAFVWAAQDAAAAAQ